MTENVTNQDVLIGRIRMIRESYLKEPADDPIYQKRILFFLDWLLEDAYNNFSAMMTIMTMILARDQDMFTNLLLAIYSTRMRME